jgi:hypothetical protein
MPSSRAAASTELEAADLLAAYCACRVVQSSPLACASLSSEGDANAVLYSVI